MIDKFLLIAVFHVVVVAPLLLWVGFNRAATPDWIYNLMFGMGIIVLIYHGYKSAARWLAASPALWINLIHVALIAPLLLWIGYHAKKTERPAYDMLLLLGFGAFGYHLYKVVIMSQTFVKPLEV
jgi:hypothetical protein